MAQNEGDKNWVSKKIVLRMALVLIVLLVLTAVLRRLPVLGIVLAAASAAMMIMFAYFSYARYKFSPAGGDVQGRISELILEKIDPAAAGRLLDIGCGSGVLSAAAAVRCPALTVDGIDYWGGAWGYSMDQCKARADAAGVGGRITWTQASAAALPFEDGTFDIIISNMVFHEVADAKDKRDVIREALRVLKPGGTFLLQDLFKVEKLYGPAKDLLPFIQSLGAVSAAMDDTSKSPFIPVLLRNSMFFGKIGLIRGKK
ncbi:class I SAM-dependent methyltransferase [Breznakiella homolactica]|uniref:Class I SAM-dependent methyltransferase n=1 Tax=Breznakiella homolactica TaxID=2798577 RepID=A0A7T7XJW3_9SPIR|nr:class I SAM-dependent methyltransferase [Breznakiella homolactica]QQO07764.1 class I SAM-dependent methyltransferase [Breznakiella homolactica]